MRSINLCFTPYITRVIKARKMGWAEHVALMEELRNAYRISIRKLEEKRPLGRQMRR
jgi:hypothetical protein